MLVHDDAVTVAPSQHLRPLVEAEMRFALVIADLRRMRDAWANTAESSPNKVLEQSVCWAGRRMKDAYPIVIVNMNRLLNLLVG